MSTSVTTHDHEQIRQWAEERGGVPARIRDTGRKDGEGVLRIHFPERSNDGQDFEQLSCDDFFKNFDRNKLDFLYQDEKADGETGTFHKFVEREKEKA